MRPVTAPPLSFVGAWQRTQRIGDRIRATAARAAYRVVVAPLVIAAWWLLVEAWYVLFIVAIPFRLIRRGSRRDRQLARTLEVEVIET
jgi:fatty acid desaturase